MPCSPVNIQELIPSPFLESNPQNVKVIQFALSYVSLLTPLTVSNEKLAYLLKLLHRDGLGQRNMSLIFLSFSDFSLFSVIILQRIFHAKLKTYSLYLSLSAI